MKHKKMNLPSSSFVFSIQEAITGISVIDETPIFFRSPFNKKIFSRMINKNKNKNKKRAKHDPFDNDTNNIPPRVPTRTRHC